MATKASTITWFFEDFVVGQVMQTGTYTVSEKEILEFAQQYDPQPFHIDRAAAKESIYGGLIASGFHTCSIIMRLVATGFLNSTSSMGSPGIDHVRWIKPVRPGDTLSVSYTTEEVKPSVSKPDRGVVRSIWEATNQFGEVVATIDCMAMFGRRPVEKENHA